MSIGQFMPMSPLGDYSIKDPDEANVIAALPMENVGDGITVFDESAFQNILIRSGTPVISEAAKKYGKSSLYFKGGTSGDYYHSANKDLFNQPTDFTVEFWVMQVSRIAGTTAYLVSHATTGGGWQEPSCGITASGNISLRVADDSLRLQGTAITLNKWHHVSYGRKFGVWYLYLDGEIQGNYSNSASWTGYSLTLGTAGWSRDTTSNGKLNGYIDEFRWWKGVSIRDGVLNFTPPKAPWTSPVITSIITGGAQFSAAYNTSSNNNNYWGYYRVGAAAGKGTYTGSIMEGYEFDIIEGNHVANFSWSGVIATLDNRTMADFLKITSRGLKNGLILKVSDGTESITFNPPTFNSSTGRIAFTATGNPSNAVGNAILKQGKTIDILPR